MAYDKIRKIFVFAKKKPNSMDDKKQIPLSELKMVDGEDTVEEWLHKTQPKEWWPLEIEAVYECLKRGWPLHIGSIQSTAREIDAKRNPKGW